jgi:hypothetical protein
MDAQALQKYYRLQISTISVGALMLRTIGFLGFFFFTSCASNLKSEGDLSDLPEDFLLEMEFSKPVVIEKSEEQVEVKKEKVEVKPKTPKAKIPEKKQAKVELPATQKKEESLSTHWPFGVGEKFKIALRWGLIEGGVVNIEVMSPKEISGKPALHFRGEVRSSKVMNLAYKIDNTIESWVDLQTLLPLRQEIRQLESGRWGRRVVLFDSDKRKSKFYEHITRKDGRIDEVSRSDKISRGAQDIFSALYFYRFVHHLPAGFRYPVHDKAKNWYVEMQYLKTETLRVPAGSFQTRKYRVHLRLDGHLESRGDIHVWVSDDDKKHLVRFQSKIKVGSVSGDLVEYSPGREISYPLPIWKTPVTQPQIVQ